MAEAGIVSFKLWVSSEFDDRFSFYVDGVYTSAASGPGLEWEEVAAPVDAGVHTLVFVFEKDATVSQGEDVARIDDLAIPGGDVAVTTNVAVATAADANSAPWTPPSLGHFRIRVTALGDVAPWLASDRSTRATRARARWPSTCR
jgi:hypothetical protein